MKHRIANHRPLRCVCLMMAIVSLQHATAQDATDDSKPRDPVSLSLLEMDLTGATSLLRSHDLDDNGSLNKTERKRLSWSEEEVKRFDLNRSGDLQHVEIALKLADERVEHGIVQMDSILAERYTRQYDSNRDGILQLRELDANTFTDNADSFDTNSDGELSEKEFIRGLAFERKFRDELGVKGCDQGGAMKLINRGDKNGDRRIEPDELQAAGLNSKLMAYDRNGDERLSVSELAEHLAARRNRLGLTPSDQLTARGILRQIDRNRDSKIDGDEIPPTQGTSFLDMYDADKDGAVTELEIESVFAKRRKELGYDDEAGARAAILIQRNDTDRSKSLSKQELVASGSDRDSPLSPTKLPLIDKDRDQNISLQELARYLQKTRE